MTLHIGDTAPDFTVDTQVGPISFHEWAGDSWVFFFSHPADFTPVCTTEMGRTAQLAQAFESRNTKPLGLSTDTAEEHRKWIDDVNDTQKTDLRFPIVADANLAIARMYDMIHPEQSETAAVRSVFIIDPAKKIRLTMTYPMSVGRNFDEVLRVIDALQLGDARRIATPADWMPGKEVIIPPSISDEEARGLFPQGWTEHRAYLRTTMVD
ncbi:peroxiredoxin [Sphingobium yanoikuyae]|jgi:thioredoxin-dependent peroxiredoxin|uniref:Alkyl hydroperoxide reductase C n=3 Tax=Sphingomonadaceae TaxID=41297 RepID=A0AA42WYZ7_SPHYA|nr:MULTISPECIES: peroxiredoxin [Sphingomonadales]MEA3387778.1 peroxiredoxin [Pseudomonadota bacterium]MBM7405058.1 peroxiredoxin (alkyl hydroperoxide reductase subunit C) [Sphingomonas sp. JUb134]MDH2132394.1 peroxiredoxin [Sphingobium yanoikuyae]MDH2152099.1 peroxiredoxin [Sphingobium yanoikuyae]MDH2167862.1 peroxiredoxin [Sphingobium yanoikuyae]